MHLVGFTIELYYNARSYKRQIYFYNFVHYFGHFFANFLTYFVLVSLLSTPIVGEFTKQIQKVSTNLSLPSISLSLCIHPPADTPAHMEQLGSNWTDFP